MLYGELPEVTLPNGDKVRGVPVSVANPPKTALLGLPTNEQMTKRLEQQKSLRRSAGGRKSQTEYVPSTKADLALFEDVRIDKAGVEFDEFEASNAIGKLIYSEAVECEREGEEYVITLKTRFGLTKHYLTIPFQRDLQLYRRSVVTSMELPHGVEELRYRIGPPVKLYDTIVTKIEGYVPSYKPVDVPPHHKSSVVVDLIQALDDLDPILDPNF